MKTKMAVKILSAITAFTGCSQNPAPEFRAGASGNWNEFVDERTGKVIAKFPNFHIDTNGIAHTDPESVAAIALAEQKEGE